MTSILGLTFGHKCAIVANSSVLPLVQPTIWRDQMKTALRAGSYLCTFLAGSGTAKLALQDADTTQPVFWWQVVVVLALAIVFGIGAWQEK